MKASEKFSFSNILLNRKFRNALTQIIVVGVISIILYWLINGTIYNLQQKGMASGFGFLEARVNYNPSASGFVFFTSNSTNLVALLSSIANTIIMAFICIIAATLIGLLVGVGRMSSNWLLRNCCLVYMEVFRNLPPLLVLLFWSFGIFKAFLPPIRDSYSLGNSFFINNQGFYFPKILWGEWSWVTLFLFFIGIIACIILHYHSKKQQDATGHSLATGKYYFLFLIIIPLISFFFIGKPAGYDFPALGRFNFVGGSTVPPETVALFLALSLYTGALISETFRSGFESVDKGYVEAAAALGLKKNLIMRLITLPLAIRIILPPLSSQYINLMKNTTLGIAIGYSELMNVSKQIWQESNHPFEIIVIWIVVYLSLSLFISVLMNWFNKKMELKER